MLAKEKRRRWFLDGKEERKTSSWRGKRGEGSVWSGKMKENMLHRERRKTER